MCLTSILYNPDWPQTHSVAETSLEFLIFCLCLLSIGLSGVDNYAWLLGFGFGLFFTFNLSIPKQS